MKMHALRGENMMRMKIFDLQLDDKGNTIIVSGKNGEGKSSLINSFVLALGGSKTDVAKLTTKPIREGAKKAWVEVEVGEYTVRRSWTSNDKDSLTITGQKGEKFSSPQKMLDKIVGDLSFDPLAFTRMKPKEQRDLLLSIVELPIDLEAHEAKRAEVYAKRTEYGRERDRLAGALETMPEFDASTPDEEVSVVTLSKELQAARDWNNTVDGCVESLDTLEKQIEDQEKALAKSRADHKLITEKLAIAQKEVGCKEDEIPHKDLSKIEQQIQDVEVTNTKIRAKKQYKDLRAQHTEQEKKYDAGTAFLEKMDKEKQTALEKAEMPIDGLSLDEDGVTFGGIPFGQLSMSQKIKVSTAIGMAQNPELRLMIVADGSLLDKDNLKALQQMADANDFQIFVEMVDDDAQTGIIIEDGEIVSSSSNEEK